MKKKLTIAIPTFNRIDGAIKVLNILIRQRGSELVRFLVADNDSKDSDILQEFCRTNDIPYVKRIVNIGPGANIMRLFEEVETEWLTIFSDDDLPRPTYIMDTLKLLEDSKSNNVVAYKHKTSADTSQIDLTINSLSEFTSYNKQMYRYSSTLLISSWVFNRDKLADYLRFSYLYFGFQAPHIMIIVAGLYNKRGAVVYVDSNALEHQMHKPNEGWSVGLTYGLMISALPTVHFFSKKDIVDLSKGIIGARAKNTIGKLLVAKKHNSGNGYGIVSLVVSKSSFFNCLILMVFNLIYPLLLNL